jgi:hypothetical protein
MDCVDVTPSSAVQSIGTQIRVWQIPIVAWLVSRIIGCIGLVVWPTAEGRWFNSFGLTHMDGGWYRIIMTIGYPNGSLQDVSSAWPFAPLYPFTADLLTRLGAPVGPSLILVSWLCALVALVGIWELARPRFGESVAKYSVWTLALLPGAVGQVLSYSDSMFVAGVIWLLVVVDRIETRVREDSNSDHLWWVVGLLFLVVSSSRPNGILILPAVLAAVWVVQRSAKNIVIALAPSLIFLSIWMIYCENKTSDALAFVNSKNTWLETTIIDFFAHPLERPAIVLHVATFAIVTLIALPSMRKIPTWWHLLSFVLLVPSLILGVEGMARYISLTAPVLIALAISLDRMSKLLRTLFFVASASAMLFLAVNVVRYTWVP